MLDTLCLKPAQNRRCHATPKFKRRALGAALASAGLTLFMGGMATTHAFTPNPVFAPKPLLLFSGTEGAHNGALPFAPPVYVESLQRLYGVTHRCGFPFTERYGEATFGGAVLYSLDPGQPETSYQAFRAAGELGKSQSLLPLWHEASQMLLSGTAHVYDPNQGWFGGYYGQLFGLKPDTGSTPPRLVLLGQPTDTLLARDAYQPKGMAAINSEGYAYYGPTTYSDACFAAAVPQDAGWHTALPAHDLAGKRNLLFRIKLGEDGAVPEPVIDFCDFAQAYVYPAVPNSPFARAIKREYHSKGLQPTHLIVGDQGNALYAIVRMANSPNYILSKSNQPEVPPGATKPADYPEPDYGNIPASDNLGVPVAAVVRIQLADLENGKLTPEDADKIEVLHWIAKYRDGGLPTIQSSGASLEGHYEHINTMIEVGDWLYGTNQTLWRLYKGDDASITERFQIVHGFDSGLGGGALEADGVQPTGPMVLAADGNLYGTARGDTRPAADGTQANTGVLFRVKIDPANPNARPIYEPLQYFDLDTVGAQPVGLSAGEILDGVQRLYGATRLSANPADPSTPLEQGAIFHVDIPLPELFTTPLTASASQARVGDTVQLSWATQLGGTCTASGDNGGIWQGEQPLNSGDTQVSVTLREASENTFVLSCTRAAGGPEVSSSVTITVTPASAEPSEPGDGGGSDGGNDGDSGGGGGALGGLLLPVLTVLGWRRRQRCA